MRKVLVFGNPYLEEDNLAVKVGNQLKSDKSAKSGFDVIHCPNPDDLLNHDLNNAVILDVAKGIDKVDVFDDLESLEFSVIFSLHDFDLSFFLKILKEAGKLERVSIIGIPQGYDEKEAIKEVKKILKKQE